VFFSSGDKDEDALEKILDQEIDQLFKLAQKYKTSENRGEIWLRLAERYVEKAQLLEFRVQRKFDSDLEKWEASKRKSNRPTLNLNASREFNKKAIQLYDAFLKAFPSDNKVDQSLFFLGYNYFELGQPEKGEGYYKQLTSGHSRSPYVNESHFALGEYYFENSKWAEAKPHYLKVAQNKRARLYSFALYKLAWCEYRLGKPATALALYEKVIRESNTSDEELEGRQKVNSVRLAREAENEIIPIFAEIKDHKDAISYFENLVGEKRINDIVERLAYVYSYAGKRSAARDMFKRLIAQDPEGEKAFDYQYQIITNYIDGGDDKIFKEEIFEWIDKYSPDSRWAKANAGNPKVLENAQTLREKTLRTFVLKSHKIAQDSKAKVAQVRASDGYKLYLSTFSDSKSVSEMHFYYGELLFDMESFEQAAVHYLWVADNDPNSPFAEKAVINTLLALERELPPEEELVKKAGQGIEKIPYTKAEMRFVKVAERFMNEFAKKSGRAADVKFKVARLQYAHNELDTALVSFWEIVEQYPKSEFATYSANLILDIYNLKGDYDGLVKAGERLLKYPKLIEKGTGADIRNVVQRAEFKRAQDLETAKDFVGSAKEYQAFAQKNPRSELASTALFNAGINFERGSQTLAAIASYTAVLSMGDKAAKTAHPRARRLVARLYESTGQLERAAVEFEKFAKDYPKDQYANESLLNAAIIFAGLKRYDRSTENYRKYYNSTRGREKTIAIFREAEIAEDRNQLKVAYANYERYIKDAPTDVTNVMAAHIRLFRLSKKLGWKTKSDEWATKTIQVQRSFAKRSGNVGKSEAAETTFHFALKKFAEYVTVKIPKSESQQEAAINKKTKMLADLTRELGEVVKFDVGEYVVAAVALIGQANEEFVNTVRAAPVPGGLTPEQEKEYRTAVEQKLAEAPKQAAIQSYELAIKRSQDLNAYNEWVIKSFEGVARLKPATVGKWNDSISFVSMVDEMSLKDSRKYELLKTSLDARDEKGVIEEGSKILAEDLQNATVLNAMAVLYLETSRPKLAQIYLSKAIAIKDKESAIHNNLGVFWMKNDDENLAISEFKKALSQNSSSEFASANLGSLLLKYQNADAAVGHLAVASKAFPKSAAVLNNYAIALRRTGLTKQAETNFEKAIENSSGDAGIHMNYARLLVDDLKDKSKAVKILNKVKFIAGEGQVSKQADEMLRRIQ
jgi:tetratricopeptide (TPR) repeat protein